MNRAQVKTALMLVVLATALFAATYYLISQDGRAPTGMATGCRDVPGMLRAEAGFIDIEKALQSGVVLEGMDELKYAYQELSPNLQGPGRVFARVVPGLDTAGARLKLDPDGQEELFEGQDLQLDAEGQYSLTSFATLDRSCGMTGIVATQRNGTKGTAQVLPVTGLCGTLSAAHSLVTRMQVVDQEWGGIIESDRIVGASAGSGTVTWSPRFLEAVSRAAESLDVSDDSMLSRVRSILSSDWNSSFEVVETQPETSIRLVEMDDPKQAMDWCYKLKTQTSDGGECILTLQSRRAGHTMAVQDVAYEERRYGNEQWAPYCRVRTIDTARIDGTLTDVVQPPLKPGVQEWGLWVGGFDVWSQEGDPSFWNTEAWNRASFACFQKKARTAAPSTGAQPGSALRQ